MPGQVLDPRRGSHGPLKYSLISMPLVHRPQSASHQFQFNIDSLQKQIVVLDEIKENLRKQLETLKSGAELNNQRLSETKDQLTATEKKIEILKIRIEQQQQQISKLQ